MEHASSTSHILVFEPVLSKRSQLVEGLIASGVRSQIVQVSELSEVSRALRTERFAICILGDSLSQSEISDAIHEREQQGTERACAIVLAREGIAGEKPYATPIGIDALLLIPATPKGVHEALTHAIEGVNRDLNEIFPRSEQVTSFPWILQGIALKLRQLSELVTKEEQESKTKIAASPKAVKEALLGVIGGRQNSELALSLSFDFSESERKSH